MICWASLNTWNLDLNLQLWTLVWYVGYEGVWILDCLACHSETWCHLCMASPTKLLSRGQWWWRESCLEFRKFMPGLACPVAFLVCLKFQCLCATCLSFFWFIFFLRFCEAWNFVSIVYLLQCHILYTKMCPAMPGSDTEMHKSECISAASAPWGWA